MARLKAVLLEVSGGNIRNCHLYLTEVMGMFPQDCVGGGSKLEAADRTVKLHINGETVDTDIAGDKKIFRDRGAIRRFFEDKGIEPGDLVIIERLADYEYEARQASKRGFKYYL